MRRILLHCIAFCRNSADTIDYDTTHNLTQSQTNDYNRRNQTTASYQTICICLAA